MKFFVFVNLAFLILVFPIMSRADIAKEAYDGIIEFSAKAKDVPSLCYSYRFRALDDKAVFGIKAVNEDVLRENLGKKVSIKGSFKTYKREFSGFEQRPIGMDVVCDYFEIETVKIIE